MKQKSKGLYQTHIKQIKKRAYQQADITDALLYTIAAIAGVLLGMLLIRSI
jgi:hypothetical protein